MPKETSWCEHHYQIEKLGLPHYLHVVCYKVQFMERWISPTFPMNCHLQHQLLLLNTNLSLSLTRLVCFEIDHFLRHPHVFRFHMFCVVVRPLSSLFCLHDKQNILKICYRNMKHWTWWPFTLNYIIILCVKRRV